MMLFPILPCCYKNFVLHCLNLQNVENYIYADFNTLPCNKLLFNKYYKQLITFPLLCFHIPFPFNVFSSAEIEIKDTVRTPTSHRASGPTIYETINYLSFQVYIRHPGMTIDLQIQYFEKVKDMFIKTLKFLLCHCSFRDNT